MGYNVLHISHTHCTYTHKNRGREYPSVYVNNDFAIFFVKTNAYVEYLFTICILDFLLYMRVFVM